MCFTFRDALDVSFPIHQNVSFQRTLFYVLDNCAMLFELDVRKFIAMKTEVAKVDWCASVAGSQKGPFLLTQDGRLACFVIIFVLARHELYRLPHLLSYQFSLFVPNF